MERMYDHISIYTGYIQGGLGAINLDLDTAYIGEYLHFRYLKCLVSTSFMDPTNCGPNSIPRPYSTTGKRPGKHKLRFVNFHQLETPKTQQNQLPNKNRASS